MADVLTKEQRSYCMSRIRGKDTLPERRVRSMLHRRGLRFRKHVRKLPGCPDIVFGRARVAVFIDGDFWHGRFFSRWAPKLSLKWRQKIEANRHRDVRNRQRLRGRGWKVVRVWESEIEKNLTTVVQKIARFVEG